MMHKKGGFMTNKIQMQADEILKLAEESGKQEDFFFTTTFQRYLVQLQILEELEQEIQNAGTMVKKEYVKGRENVYTNPSINAYNRTVDSANKTVTTLLKIINGGTKKAVKEDDDVLLKLINGSDTE
jgi:hypothetical protein